MGKDAGVWAFQLPDDLKALIELREDIHHRTGKECMLWCLLELKKTTHRVTIHSFRVWKELGLAEAALCSPQVSWRFYRIGQISLAEIKNFLPITKCWNMDEPLCSQSSQLTPSFLSRSRAPRRNSRDTSSFSSSHCSTNCSNHL